MAPPLVVHGFANTTEAEVSFLNFHLPGCGFIDFMRGMRDGESRPYDQHDPPADGGRDPGDASIGPLREPFARLDLAPGERVPPGPEGAMRMAYVIAGELEGDLTAGSFLELEASSPLPPAASPTQLLVLDP